MSTFRAEILINRPLPQVWAVFVDPAVWPDWHGGEIARIEPGWQAGGLIHWKLGAPSRIVAVVDQKSIKLRGSLGGSMKGPENEWSFAALPGGTRVELVEDYSEADSYVSDGAARQRHLNDTLAKLKQVVESSLPSEGPLPVSPAGAQTWISYQCSRCQKKMRSKPELAGKRVNCPGCGQAIAVPAAQSGQGEAIQTPRANRPAPVEPPPPVAEVPSVGSKSIATTKRQRLEALDRELEALPVESNVVQKAAVSTLRAMGKLLTVACEGVGGEASVMIVNAERGVTSAANVLGQGHLAVVLVRKMIAIVNGSAAAPDEATSDGKAGARAAKPRSKKGCLIAGGVAVVLLLGMCLVTALIAIPAMEAEKKAVRAEGQTVLRLIGDGKTADAYAALALAYRAETNEAAFAEVVNSLNVAGYTAWEEKQLRHHSLPRSGWTLEGYAIGPGQRVTPVTMEFVKEGEKWKLWSIRKSPASK